MFGKCHFALQSVCAIFFFFWSKAFVLLKCLILSFSWQISNPIQYIYLLFATLNFLNLLSYSTRLDCLGIMVYLCT